MIPRRLQSQEGWALVTSVTLMAVMLSLGLATFSLVDNGTKRSREQRELESSLALAEGAMFAQALTLARAWPTNTANRPKFEPSCANTTPTTATYAYQCPNPATLSATDAGTATDKAVFRSVDFLAGSVWHTKVRDDCGSLASDYVPAVANNQLACTTASGTNATCAAPCTYDFNGNRQMWVQTRTQVKGQIRNVVALMKLEELAEEVPRAAVAAGALRVTNQNNTDRETIEGGDGGVFVACETNAENCAEYPESDVSPAPVKDQTHMTVPLMNAEQLARMKERAISDDNYYSGCPTKDPVTNKYDLSGAVVWVEGCVGTFDISSSVLTNACGPGVDPDVIANANSCINSMQKPGTLIWHCSSLSLGGNSTFVGLVYMVNNSDGTCASPMTQIGNKTCPKNDKQYDVLELQGNFHIQGAVAIDGPGCFRAGSSGLQVVYDRNVFNAIRSYGTAGLVQNTWRELPGNAAF